MHQEILIFINRHAHRLMDAFYESIHRIQFMIFVISDLRTCRLRVLHFYMDIIVFGTFFRKDFITQFVIRARIHFPRCQWSRIPYQAYSVDIRVAVRLIGTHVPTIL